MSNNEDERSESSTESNRIENTPNKALLDDARRKCHDCMLAAFQAYERMCDQGNVLEANMQLSTMGTMSSEAVLRSVNDIIKAGGVFTFECNTMMREAIEARKHIEKIIELKKL